MPPAARVAAFAVLTSLFAMPMAVADQGAQDRIKQGEYLARLGDCFACHTATGGKMLAGGRQLPNPYGTIASPNITPDPDTGIGKWSDDDFYRLMHDGITRDGSFVYPVMPFDHYTKVTRDDDLAIKAYLFSVAPVHAPHAKNHMPFPFDIREGLAAWRALYFTEGTFKPDPARTEQENRGAYLVEGLGHCGSCHTPRNALMGTETSKSLGGGEVIGQGWFAPNISSDVHEGIGAWSTDQLVEYLKTGVAPGRAVTAGPMAETIHDSLRYATDADLHAIAAYLKEAPAKELYSQKSGASPSGATAYLTNCGFCHQPNGQGIAGAIPPLAGNGVVLAGGPDDVIRTIQGGLPAQGPYSPMPGFAKLLTSGEIAEITNYVRASFGNKAPPTATTRMVDDLARTTSTMWSGTGTCPPVTPPKLASAIDAAGGDAALRRINSGDLTQNIDAFLAKLRASDNGIAQADVVNGVTAAFCPVVMHDTSMPELQRVELLQRFATVLYSRLTSHDLTAEGDGAQHASPPPVASTTPN